MLRWHCNPGWLEELIDTNEAERLTGRPKATLETLRTRGGGPVYFKQGRVVRYRRRDLLEWATSDMHRSTSDNSEDRAC